MSGIKIDTFGGMIPAVDDRLLPGRAAAHSENTWLYSGRLAGIPQLTEVRALTTGTAKIFRIPNSYSESTSLDDSIWMEFENADTDVVRSVVIDDDYDRYYWASSSQAPRYNTKERIENGDNEWLLGVPSPGQPALVVTGGAAANVTRSYVHTWVTNYGEEGPPSDPITVTDNSDGSWDITLDAAAATDLGDAGDDRYITHSRIYRTVTSGAGVATYFLVAEQVVSDTTYSDTASDDTVSANNQLESTNWTAPPTDLQGFVTMPNGMVVAWRANEVWFSEPYRPHAWPVQYVVAVDYPIVGLGITGQTLVICTRGFPAHASGVHPSTMAFGKHNTLEPCLSRGSILSTPEGVHYVSPNGLIRVAAGQVVNVTRNLVYKDKWQQLTVPTFRVARIGTGYFGFGGSTAGVFQTDTFQTDAFQQTDFGDAYMGIYLDLADERIGFNLMSDPVPISGVQNDPWSDDVYIIKSDTLYRIDLADRTPTPRVFLWRSKILQYPYPVNLGAMKVYFEVPGTAPDALVEAPDLDREVEFPELPDGSTLGVVRVYADNTLVFTRNLVTSGEIMKLPSGFKANFWQVEFETYVTIFSVQMARTTKELASV